VPEELPDWQIATKAARLKPAPGTESDTTILRRPHQDELSKFAPKSNVLSLLSYMKLTRWASSASFPWRQSTAQGLLVAYEVFSMKATFCPVGVCCCWGKVIERDSRLLAALLVDAYYD
jgi:hypothetical protein